MTVTSLLTNLLAWFQAKRRVRDGAVESALIRDSGLFDEEYYWLQYPDVRESGTDPLVHYLGPGWRENKSPHPIFDSRTYRRKYETEEASDTPPLIHYLKTGWREGKNPHSLFHTAYYQSQLIDPSSLHEEPLRHYLTRGAAEGLNPNPYFHTRYYVRTNRDVAQTGINPLAHYLLSGSAEGRRPSEGFDPKYYRRTNADVREGGIEPLVHYIEFGRREGRRPCDPRDEAGIIDVQTLKGSHDQITRCFLAAFLHSGALLQFPAVDSPLVSVILVLHNRAELTIGCLQALLAESVSVPLEVIIVDNASSDRTSELLQQISGATFIRNTANRHFIDGCNQAARVARGRYLLFLNNDATLTPGSIAAAVRTHDSDETIGAVGAQIRLLNGQLQEAGSIIWKHGGTDGYGRLEPPDMGEFMFQRDVDYCSGAFLLTPRKVFDRFGGFDTRFRPAYFEDADYGMTLRTRGLRVVYEPRAVLMHYEHGSSHVDSARNRMIGNRRRFTKKHESALAKQPDPGVRNALLIARSASRPGSLRVLYVDDRIPHRSLGSGFPRAVAVVNGLAALGHLVSIYPCQTPHSEDWTSTYRDIDRRVEILRGDDSLADHLALRRNFYDLIVVSRIHNYKQFLDDGCLQLKGDARLIYDSEAIFAIREHYSKQLSERPSAVTLEAAITREIDSVSDAGAVIAVSRAEADHFTRRRSQPAFVIGHSCTIVATQTPFEQRDSILFVGAMHHDTSPNVDAVTWFVSYVLPLLEERLDAAFRFRVVGYDNSSLAKTLSHPRLTLVGEIPDLRPEYEQARLFVAPMRYGAGISLKTYDSAAAGVPLVATPLVADQLGWKDGEDLLAAETPVDFADRCVALYTRPELWESLRARGIQRVREDCDPGRFQDRIRQVCEALTRAE